MLVRTCGSHQLVPHPARGGLGWHAIKQALD